MRKFYIIIFLIFIGCILIFISSFVYLDKQSRKTYHYVINQDGHDVGTIKIDRYKTEDRIIYKSVSSEPFDPMLTESRIKMILDKRHDLVSYFLERYGNGASESIYFEKTESGLSFLSNLQSEFACLSNIPVRRVTFVFKEDAPVTYLPMIENYNFRKGKSQGFNAVTQFSPILPPIKRFVTFTSVRDEYIKIGSKKIKTECLLVKIRNYPQGTVWVSKHDRSLIMIELPSRNLKIIRTFKPRVVTATEYIPESGEYASRSVTFKNKNVQLSGTLTFPQKEGRFPGVLLLWGAGAQDREYYGIFTFIADYLAKQDFCVLRFDKRGIGSSGDNFASITSSDENGDINAALEYLTSQKEVDPKKVAVIGHAEGAVYASKTASENNAVKALVLMAPAFYSGLKPDTDPEKLKRMAAKYGWNEDYLKTALKSRLETMDKVKNAKHDWISISGSRCFVKRLREEMDSKPFDSIKNIKIPVLIIEGKIDESSPGESASLIDKTLEESGNKNHKLVYFGYLDSFLAKQINDGVHKVHYEPDSAVLETVKNWLKANLVEAQDVREEPQGAVPEGITLKK